MLTKVVSGFQSGVDIAGIIAAHDCKIPTGGYIPKGFKTLDGPKPEYSRLYGAIEHSSANYRDRTWDNIQMADATLRFANNWNSPGEKCTLNGLNNWNKPHLDISIIDGKLVYQKLECFHDLVFYVGDWLDVTNPKVLNIAGNSEQTYPGIYSIVYDFLEEVFNKVKGT